MADAVYPKYKEALLDALSGVDLNDGTLKAALIDTGTYTYSAAHEFHSDLSGIVGTPTVVASTTVTNGLLDGADVTFTAVSGSTVEAVVLYLDSGVSGTSRLVAYLDSLTGLPVTPNGGDIVLQWNASGIVQF